MSGVSALHIAWFALRVLLVQVIVEPVREGGPRPLVWPRPVRRAMLVLAAVYATLVIASLLSRFAPEPPTASFTLSQPGRWLVSLGTSAVLYCLYVASVHLRLWLQLVIGVVLAGPIGAALTASFLLAVALGPIGPIVFFVLLVPMQVAAWIALIVLALRQRRHPLTGRWLLAVALAFSLAYVIPHVIANVFGKVDDATVQVMTFLTMMILLIGAMPLAIAAGAAFAEITLRAVSWSATTLRDEGPGVLGPVAVGVLVAGHAYAAWAQVGLRGVGTRQAWLAAATAVGLLLPTQVAVWAARRRRPVEAPRPLDIADRLPGLALLLGLAVTAANLTLVVWGSQPRRQGLLMGAIGLLCWAYASLAALRGRTAQAALGASIGSGFLLFLAHTYGLDLVRDAVTNRVLALVLLGALAWWGVRGRLTAGRWLVVAIGLALTLLFPFRQAMAEPLNALIEGATGTLIFGLVWRVLTDAGFTRHTSPRFPIDSRAFLFAAFVLTAATAVITTTYGQGNAVFDLDSQERTGNSIMGRYALVAAVVGLLEIGRFGVDPDPGRPPPPPDLAALTASRGSR